MAEHTETDWCNDSAMLPELESALACGAVGCTSNPPLTFQALTENADAFREELAEMAPVGDGDEKAVAFIGVVVRTIARRLRPVFDASGGRRGYIRAQVQPLLGADFDGMLAMGRTFASWAPNIKVKIPGTGAGVRVLEELAALGIPTNPTVCTSVSQMIAAAEAHERGIARAAAAGRVPAHSSSAFVLGRLQDYLAALNEERSAGLSSQDLECAVIAAAKRCCEIFAERKFTQEIMPAAFRSARQVAELSGSPTVMTIHPKIQDLVIEADGRGELRREPGISRPIDSSAVNRVLAAIPEFRQAYEPNGLTPDRFDTFGATVMTLTNFDRTGWQKLRSLSVGA